MSDPIRKKIILQLIDKLQGVVNNFAVYTTLNTSNGAALHISGTYADARTQRKFMVTATGAHTVSIIETTTPMMGEVISTTPRVLDSTTSALLATGVTLQGTTLTPGDTWLIRVGLSTLTLFQVQPYWSNEQNEAVPSATLFIEESSQTPMPLNRYEISTRFMAMVKMSQADPSFLLTEDFIADVKDEISRDINLYDGTQQLATNLVIDNDRMYPDEAGTDTVMFTITFVVTFRTAFANSRQIV